MRSQPVIGTVCVWLAAVCLAVLAGCSRKESGPSAQESRTAASGTTPPTGLTESPFAESLPKVGGPADYVGSSNCRLCHQEQFDSWHRTYHRTMTQVASATSVQADFGNVVLTNDGTRFVLSRTNDEFWVHMERAEPGASADSPAAVDARIALLTGSHHMQVFWLPTEQGNAQIGFPFTWLIPEKRWVPRKATFVRPPDAPHLAEFWNTVCSRCHTTAVEPHIDSVHHLADTRVAELGIACEACHGPGQHHVTARRVQPGQATVEAELLRREIIHPKKLDPSRASQVCGFCHSMKWFDKSDGWWEHGFRFRPGDDLEQTTPIIRPGHIQDIPGLAAYLERHADLLPDFFWPDGMIRVSGRDYNGLIESPCFRGGKFSCLSCHSMHKSEPDGLLARNRDDNRACTQCHEQFSDESRLLAHTHHRAGSSGSDCYNCHMPRTTYGVLKAIRSHQISSPSVAAQLATGRPNACNLCHLDKPLAWTADHLAQWYRQSTPQLSIEDRAVSDAVRLALAGDAGQRALLAWHFGWEPALQTSGRSWITPVLAQLLDDPYAAVRCIAQRSLRRVSTVPLTDYDFSVTPSNRPSLRSSILELWAKTTQLEPNQPLSGPTQVQIGDPVATQQAFDKLALERNNRPVRLRE